jgi:hypothetical protein
MALATVLLTGCSGDTDAGTAGPSVIATGPHPSSPTAGAPTSTAPTSTATAPTSPATEARSDVPAACTAYSVMVAAIEDAAQDSSDPEEIAAAIAPVMKRFAAQVPDLPRPPGMSPETWAGVVALAAQIRTLPDHPSSADIGAVQQQLTVEQRRAVEAAAAWFKSSCGL